MEKEFYEDLCKKALKAREMSYCPYSDFAVGAALASDDGSVYTGCNIENAAFTPGNCAERTALFKPVSEVKRKFLAIAIAGGRKGAKVPLDECPPCGVCRQVMMEFCDPKTFEIVLARSEHDYRICLLGDLLPLGFGPGNIS